MDPYDSPLRSPIVVPITNSPIRYRLCKEESMQVQGVGHKGYTYLSCITKLLWSMTAESPTFNVSP